MVWYSESKNSCFVTIPLQKLRMHLTKKFKIALFVLRICEGTQNKLFLDINLIIFPQFLIVVEKLSSILAWWSAKFQGFGSKVNTKRVKAVSKNNPPPHFFLCFTKDLTQKNIIFSESNNLKDASFVPSILCFSTEQDHWWMRKTVMVDFKTCTLEKMNSEKKKKY